MWIRIQWLSFLLLMEYLFISEHNIDSCNWQKLHHCQAHNCCMDKIHSRTVHQYWYKADLGIPHCMIIIPTTGHYRTFYKVYVLQFNAIFRCENTMTTFITVCVGGNSRNSWTVPFYPENECCCLFTLSSISKTIKAFSWSISRISSW